MQLNEKSDCTAYVLGRLFAVLEKVQERANGWDKPGNTSTGHLTIRSRYFTNASTTPASTFPVILRLSQHHIRKMPLEREGDKNFFDGLIGRLMEKIHEPIPAHLNLQEQGIFYLGYYHQRQDFFKGRKEKENE